MKCKVLKLKPKIILTFFLILVAILSSCGINKGMEYYIFADINECLSFETAEESIRVEKYNSTEKDGNITDLEYNSFYGAEIESSSYKFEIFAYEFENDDASKIYFESVSGKTCSSESAFFGSGGVTSYTLVVVNFNKAYKIHTTTKDIEEIKELLSNVFSEKLNFTD